MTVLDLAQRHWAADAVTRSQALVIAAAELAGRPLDVRTADDAAVCLIAGRLFMEGVGLDDALLVARRERARSMRRRLGIPDGHVDDLLARIPGPGTRRIPGHARGSQQSTSRTRRVALGGRS
jgi:hypothetical protein